jgi:uncharacterized protein YciI
VDTPDSDDDFLRSLVKTSRQRPHHVKWVDRDGAERTTVLSGPESARLAAIAGRSGTSKVEVLRRAAHIPVDRQTKPHG